jgi:UDP-N-acetylglucosamine/UDP-N-acetylgalactosamine diphosphorylase
VVDHFALAETLQKANQAHLLEHAETLDAEQRTAFLAQLASIPWSDLNHQLSGWDIDELAAPDVVTLADRQQQGAAITAQGEAAYTDGKVAVLLVAGGMGSRLGFQGPKGCYEIGAHSGKSIYQLQAEKVLSLSRRVGKPVPFLVMTSPMTDAETRDYFAVNDNFGVEDVRFFSQGVLPTIDLEGKALLKGPGQLLTNPDGHGGCFTALVTSGLLKDLQEAGVEYLIYIQVDNFLAPVDDPDLIGTALAKQADVVTKVLPKANPDEKVGHLVKQVKADGNSDRIVEYTELTPEQTRLTGADGQPIFTWGSPGIFAWRVGFFSEQAEKGYISIPHRSKKPVQAWQDGSMTEVTAHKCERFLFDIIAEAEVSLGFEIIREDEFAPVKNREGVDSAVSAKQLASDLYRRWFESVGVSVSSAPEQLIEVSPRFAATQAQFQQAWDGRLSEISGEYYLEVE